jgi:muramoyltetrapeptide carboxypeptidase LdcA involved in peptidoglycan recycling
MNLIKPARLCPGDKVATVSLSWGGAGDSHLLWRYQVGKKRLEEEFGLTVVEMPHTLKGSEYIYAHPERRAEDLLAAFADKSIRGIISCIGGSDSIRILPYIDYSIIRENPKVFLGYSDTTVTHLICYQAGLSSFYGASVLAEFAENVAMFDYTKYWVKKALFDRSVIGAIEPSPVWASDLSWDEMNKDTRRKTHENTGYEVLQGRGTAKGRLLGGCIEVLEMLKGTAVWPPAQAWDGAILFLETSEDKPSPVYVEYWLRNYGAQGILSRVNGLIVG